VVYMAPQIQIEKIDSLIYLLDIFF
jgi:hypothetical protein